MNDEIEYKIPDGYEFSKIINGKIIIKPKKLKYPKNYKECCDVLGLNTMDNDAQGYKGDEIIRFQELLIARDAYWKICGEQIGLGKSWEPDFTNYKKSMYCIYTVDNKPIKDFFSNGGVNIFLVFPIEEVRDVFFENFKDLIERCKSFL